MRLQEAVSRLWSAINSHSELCGANKELYFAEILSALRGPDAESVYNIEDVNMFKKLKALTTGRIRDFLGIHDRNGLGWTSQRYYCFNEHDLKYLGENLYRICGHHFSSHVYRAVEAIRVIFGVNLMNPEEMSRVSNSKMIRHSNSDTD